LLEKPTPGLPKDAIPLELALSFPLSVRSLLEPGEKRLQYLRWEVYVDREWMQIWLGQKSYGLYVYALRWGASGGRFRVLESWFAPNVWTRQEPEQHREFVTLVLDSLAGTEAPSFTVGRVGGRRGRKSIEISGAVATHDEVEELARCLKEQIARMIDDDHDG
jgi:hypothetical protein